MGIGIHYSGKINPKASLPSLIAEVEALANEYAWESVVYRDDFPSNQFGDSYSDQIFGIAVVPPNCDPLFLCFLSNGHMSSPLHLESFGYSDDLIHKEYLYMLSVNTLQAGVEVHVKLINMLKQVSKYLVDFDVNDEGGYWDSDNKDLLTEAFFHRMQLMELLPIHQILATWTSTESIRQYLHHVMTDLIHKQ